VSYGPRNTVIVLTDQLMFNIVLLTDYLMFNTLVVVSNDHLTFNIVVLTDNALFNLLTLNDPYMGRTAQLTSRRCILYIYSINTRTE